MNEEIVRDLCDADASILDKHQTNTIGNPEWMTAKALGRWAPFFDPKTRTYAPPPTEARKKARRQKYAWKAMTTVGDPAYVPLNLCMTGDELRAERQRIAGDGSSFRVPRTDEARELVGLLPHGRLRTCESLLLLLLAYAMLVRRRHGLVATLGELGELVGLRVTATSEAMARLIALGFVHAAPTYTRFGACESQRGNLWRLTTQAMTAFALQDLPPGIELPTGTVDRVRLQRRRTCPVPATAPTAPPAPVPSPGIATPRNPEANPDALCTPEKKPESFRNGYRRPDIDRSPQAATGDVRPVPAARPVPAVPATRQGETRRTSRGLGREVVSADIASAIAEFASLVADPDLRAAALMAERGPVRPRALDDTEKRFSLLELDGAKGGAK